VFKLAYVSDLCPITPVKVTEPRGDFVGYLGIFLAYPEELECLE
jgi:hypothetical protein